LLILLLQQKEFTIKIANKPAAKNRLSVRIFGFGDTSPLAARNNKQPPTIALASLSPGLVTKNPRINAIIEL